jgi:hypothetical protein
MVEMPLREHLMVKEVTEWAVADVVQESRDAQGFLDKRR